MENLNIEKNSAKKPCGKYTLLAIFSAIIYLTVNVYLIARLVSITGLPNGGEKAASLLVYLLVELSILGSALNIVATALAVIGLVLTALRRQKGQKTLQLFVFSVLTALPILTEVILFLACV